MTVSTEPLLALCPSKSIGRFVRFLQEPYCDVIVSEAILVTKTMKDRAPTTEPFQSIR